MSNRGQAFEVEVIRRKPNADYASKAGDPRRSGRVDHAVGMMSVHVEFVETSASIEAKLGVHTVGVITHDVTSKGYIWSVDLTGMSRIPKRANDVEAGKRAILHKVREWCEAAKLITARRA